MISAVINLILMRILAVLLMLLVAHCLAMKAVVGSYR